MEKVKNIFYIVLAVIAVTTALFTIERHFAKSKEVENIDDRLDISIIDDQIFQQEQAVQRIEDFQRYEQRTVEPELTPIEKDTLKKARERLDTLKNRKEEKINAYEKGR